MDENRGHPDEPRMSQRNRYDSAPHAKATAVWLVENTSLTFDQIAAFCGLTRSK